MRLRLARKVLKAVRRGPLRHRLDTVRRAALRAWISPMQFTERRGPGDNVGLVANARHVGGILKGRSLVISPCLVVFEQPRRIFDAKRTGECWTLVPRAI